jgi:hemin uptake protein HemP
MAEPQSTSENRKAEQKASPVRRTLTSRELLGTAREAVIEHGGEEYRLRITSNQKLILTK